MARARPRPRTETRDTVAERAVIVVHACWSPSGFRLWGESPHLPATAAPRRGRPPRVPRTRPHPFAADLHDLRDAVGRLGGTDARAADEEVTLRLPSHATGPQASPLLARARAVETDAREPGGAAPWTVPALALSHSAALDLFLALPASPPEGVVPADTLLCFAELAKLALEMVARGRVLPGLERSGGGGSAVWRPVLTGEDDAERLGVLRRALPEACRTVEAEEAGEDVAAQALGALVDALPPRKRGRPTAADRWLAALLAGDGGAVDAEVEAVRGALAAWSKPLAPTGQGGLRTCFRLAPPAGDAEEGAPGPRGAGDAWRTTNS